MRASFVLFNSFPQFCLYFVTTALRFEQKCFYVYGNECNISEKITKKKKFDLFFSCCSLMAMVPFTNYACSTGRWGGLTKVYAPYIVESSFIHFEVQVGRREGLKFVVLRARNL